MQRPKSRNPTDSIRITTATLLAPNTQFSNAVEACTEMLEFMLGLLAGRMEIKVTALTRPEMRRLFL